MPATSEARIIANRQNSLKSKGPTSDLGKCRSSRNSLKHGMTGRGIVIPETDLAAVEERKVALQAEFAPKTVMGAILIGQMATLSIRMERGAEQEFSAVAARRRHARDDFDEERLEKAEALWDGIADDPRGNLRKLRKSPEGVELMFETWHELRADLTREGKPLWTAAHLVRAGHLIGLREEEARGSRLGALSRAAWGNFEGLADRDGAGLDGEGRKAWARDRLVEAIDEEIADLEAHYETLDFETIEKDRNGAEVRASFDPSKEACLARRYEAEARRGFFKAYLELQKVEAEADEREASAPPPANVSGKKVCDSLASFCKEAPPAPVDPVATPPERTPGALKPVPVVAFGQASVARGQDGKVVQISRPSPPSK